MIRQCDDTQTERKEMFRSIQAIHSDEIETFMENVNTFATMMGRPIGGMSEKVMYQMRIACGQYIHKIYKRRIKTPEGIG